MKLNYHDPQIENKRPLSCEPITEQTAESIHIIAPLSVYRENTPRKNSLYIRSLG